VTKPSTGRIFINYRRQDTAWQAVALYHRLAERFGEDQIFKDVDNIGLGEDFVQKITTEVESCDILLALIGKSWLDLDAGEGRRIDDPNDFVRIEIEAALKREVLLIPILVDGATMPPAASVPSSIALIARRQALELNPNRFSGDTDELLEVLERTLAELERSKSVPADELPVELPPGIDSGLQVGPPDESGNERTPNGSRIRAHSSQAESDAGRRKNASEGGARRRWIAAAVAGLAVAMAAGAGIGYLLADGGEPGNEPVATGDAGQETQDTDTDGESAGDGSKFGSREDPLPIKTRVDMGAWNVRITSVKLDATNEILAEETTEKPKPGHQFVRFGVDAKYEDSGSGDAYSDIDWAIVGSKGNTFSVSECTTANDLAFAGETFTNGKVSGDLCISIPKDQLDGATLKLESFDTDPSTRAFFALD